MSGDSKYLRISQLANAPGLDEPGIYAWYYFPEFSDKDIDRITEKIRSDDEDEKKEGIKSALDLIDRHYFRAYLYQSIWKADETRDRYLRIPYSGVTPKFEVQMKEVPNDGRIGDKLRDDPGLLAFWADMIRQTLQGEFLSPIYVGKAERQTLRERLTTHVKEIDSTLEDINKLEKTRRKAYFSEQEKGKHGRMRSVFAVRVVKYGLNKMWLRVVAQPIDADEARIGNLEHFINRVVRPPYGRK